MKHVDALLKALSGTSHKPAEVLLLLELIEVRAELAVMQDCFYEMFQKSNPEFQAMLSDQLQKRRDEAARTTLERVSLLFPFLGGTNPEGQN